MVLKFMLNKHADAYYETYHNDFSIFW